MKNFWALPTFLRLALASAHSFSVTDDLLAFPQYEVIYSDAYVSEEHAAEILSSQDHLANGEPQQSPISASISHSNPHGSGRQSASHDGDEIEHSYQMMIRDSQRFLCDVPHPPPPPPFNQSNTQPTDTEKEEEAKELMRATERGWELLQDMQGQCIYFLSGWWSYSFCYNEGVKQFHSLPPSKNVPVYPPVEDPQVQSYVLGLFPEARAAKEKAQKEVDDDVSRSGEQETGYGGKVKGTDVARLETKGESRYLVQRLGGGTLCDLTNKERRIEVQFHCYPQSNDHIGLIKEVSTCTYLMVINTPRLCNDVAFFPPQKHKPHPISCRAVLAPADIPTWTAEHAPHLLDAQAMEDLIRNVAANVKVKIDLPRPLNAQAEKDPHPLIGDIALGARLFVPPSKTLTPSVVGGGPNAALRDTRARETLLGIIESSDPERKTLTEKDLKRLDVVKPKELERLRRELVELAGERAWRLELVDTEDGREFRGIVGKEGEEDPVDGDGGRGGKGEGKGEGRVRKWGDGKKKGKTRVEREEGWRREVEERRGRVRDEEGEEYGDDEEGAGGSGSEETYERDEL